MRLEPLSLWSFGLTWLSSRWLRPLVYAAVACLVTLNGGLTRAHVEVGLASGAGGGGSARGVAAAEEAACPAEAPPYDCAFAQGYRDAGGPAVYLRHLIEDVRPCEGEWGVAYQNGYVSAFQFTPGSWATAASGTGLADPLDPYHVGQNVAWWINHIDNPGSTSGWPVCWFAGGYLR